MRNIEFKPLNLLFNIIVALVLLTPFGVEPIVSVGVAFIVGVLAGFVPSKSVAARMALSLEIWRNHIEETLFKDNAFLNFFSPVDEDNIIGGKVVHIPQSGGGSKVVRNRSSLPATVRQRTDTEVLYLIDEYSSDPVHIKNAETKELSYDKRDSVLREELNTLDEEVAEGVLDCIVNSPTGSNATLPSTNILNTDNSTKTSPAPFDNATGLREDYKIGDLQRMRNFFKKQKAWKEGRMYALLTSDAETQMFPADSLVTATYMAGVTEEERRNGVMYKCQGWKLLSRSSCYRLTAAGVFVPYGAVGNATDCEGVLFWNQDMIELAKGNTEFFDDMGNPVWYGDIYSFLVRVGARARRKLFEGVAVLKQKVAA